VRKICEPFFEQILDDLEAAVSKVVVCAHDNQNRGTNASHRVALSAALQTVIGGNGRVEDSPGESNFHSAFDQKHVIGESKMLERDGNRCPIVGTHRLASSSAVCSSAVAPTASFNLASVGVESGDLATGPVRSGSESLSAGGSDMVSNRPGSLEGRFATAPQKARKLCYFWKKKGWCKFQNQCKFSHAEHMCGAKAGCSAKATQETATTSPRTSASEQFQQQQHQQQHQQQQQQQQATSTIGTAPAFAPPGFACVAVMPPNLFPYFVPSQACPQQQQQFLGPTSS
jgi:hypothetical protein